MGIASMFSVLWAKGCLFRAGSLSVLNQCRNLALQRSSREEERREENMVRRLMLTDYRVASRDSVFDYAHKFRSSVRYWIASPM